MQSRNWVFLRRGGVTSSLVALFLLCLSGTTPVGSAVAQAAEAHGTASAPLALGSGYGRPEGSARVRTLQQRLRKLEHQPGPVDGLYGPLTEAAVKRFQSSAGLQVDGIAGPRTLNTLRSEWPQPVGRGEGYGRRGGSDRVRVVQRRLRTADQRPGPVDGVFGPRTEAAVIRFQSKTGLAADGVVGQNTWRALEQARSRFAARHADKNTALIRAAKRLRRQVADGRSAMRPSKFPVASSDEQDFDLLLLGVITAMAFVVAGLGHALARRRVPVPEGSHREVWPVPVHAATDQVRGRQKSEPGRRDGDAVRAVGYVSGVGPPALAGPDVRKQIAAIGAACDQRGWELTEIVRDGRATDGRPTTPGLAYAVERLAVEEPSCLVVAELRRLSESPGELRHIIQSLRERDVRLVAVNAELDTSTAEGRLAADALISVGELEQEPEAQQTQEEVPTAAAKGSPSSRPAVRDLPALRKHIVAMRSSGMTLQAIADRLNAEGVPTLRGGKMWRPSSVQSAVGYRRPGQPSRAGSLPTGRLGGQ
jgi:peptidoglycan hydrolase-like protein with peptidoglycan-binding domain/DNA invertase Pin-like site-specific DNA recombinase